MEPSAIARALESLAGPWLSPLVWALRVAAVLTVATALALSVWRVVTALAAWKYGWERRVVVRCPRCGLVATDPRAPACPEGHAVRFPPGVARAGTGENQTWRAIRRGYAVAIPAAAGALAVWGYFALRTGHLRLSLAAILASCSYLFFAALLFCASWALGPGPRGAIARALHLALAALFVAPSVVLYLLAELVEPPARTPLGALWSTPTATYVSRAGHRARRVGPAAQKVRALVVEGRIPALGVVWQGLEGWTIEGRPVPWGGSGGFLARRLEQFAGPLSTHGVWLSRFERDVALKPNGKLWIVSDRRRLFFLREDELDVPEVPSERMSRGPPL